MSLKKFFVIAALVACGSTPAPKPTTPQAELGPAPADDAARLDWALAAPTRSAENRARDGARHPKETLTFFGLKKTMNVVELSPGGGWYTEILGPYLRDDGKLGVTGGGDIDKKLASYPSAYGKVEVRRSTPTSFVLGPDGSADLVVTFRNFHNWVQDGIEKLVVEAAFKVLKRGGTFGIVEHRGDPGMDLKAVKETGYVPEQMIVDLMQAAGFKLAGKSDVNANPKDDHKHEGGVWALPPRLTNGAKDREAYLAIGESDRMTLKFEKP